MAATFPLLNLSPAVSERILGSLTLAELFDLSLCSKRTFTLIKSFCSKPPNSSRIVIAYDDSSNYVLRSHRTRQNASWLFYGDRDPRALDLEDPITYKIAGCEPIEFCISSLVTGTVQYGCVSRHSPQDVLKFGEYLRTLFNCYMDNLVVNPRLTTFLDCFLSMESFRKLDRFSVSFGNVTHKDLQRILGRIEAEEMNLEFDTKENFSLDQPIRCDHFNVSRASWVNLQVLQKLDCKTAYISTSPMSDLDLNTYLKAWLDGSDTKLEYIAVSGLEDDATEKYDLSKIVEGIPSTPGVAKRQNATSFHYFEADMDYASGVDLKRESDGMLATALIQDHLKD